MLWSIMRLIFKTSSVTPDFFYVFNLILSFSTCSESFEKICAWELLGANVLKYNCSYHGNYINISSRAANTHPIMGKAHPSSHARSYKYPKHYVSLTDYPIARDIKPAHRILSLTHSKCRGKPIIRILPPLLQKNKYGRSQLYRDQIFSHTITTGNLIGV